MATLIANSAYAEQGYSISNSIFVIAPNAIGLSSVPCKNAAQKVLGGGFTIIGPSTRQYFATGSYPNSTQTGWNVEVRNNEVLPIKVSVYAICAVGQELYQAPSSGFSPFLGPATTSPNISCFAFGPFANSKILSGGFSVSGSPPHPYYAIASAPLPSQTGWVATVRLNAPALNVSVYAICAANKAGYLIVTGAPVSAAPNASNSTTVFCPVGRKILGGGFNITGSAAAQYYATQSSPVQSPFGWAVTVRNNGTTSVTAVAYAICAA